MLKDFPYWHQRLKLLTFNVNTRINYSRRTTAAVQHLRSLLSLERYKFSHNWITVSMIFWQTYFIFQLIFKQVQMLCIINKPYNNNHWEFAIVVADCCSAAAASYSALAVAINWFNAHPIAFTWLQQPLLQTLVSFVTPNIVSLQQWTLPVVTTSPSRRLLLIFVTSKRCPCRYLLRVQMLSQIGRDISFQHRVILAVT
jgi:hypothetical protein